MLEMKELSDSDWELINAYHDGELNVSERQDLETRLQADPSLKTALKSVGTVSASLGALRPTVGETTHETAPSSVKHYRSSLEWFVGCAVAAAVALFALFGPAVSSDPSLFEIHSDYAKQSYPVDASAMRLAQSWNDEETPDLSSANLTPVALHSIDGGTVAHYAGRNGCRLSYFQGSIALDKREHSDGEQVVAWSTDGDKRHVLVATGMDQQRFDTIATYLMLATRQAAQESALAAVSKSSNAAAPCVG